MNWQQKVFIERNTIENNIKKGYKYLVNEYNPKANDVDSDSDEFLYNLIGEVNPNHFFHVGFNFGYDMINLHRLYPDLIIGGITWFDTSVSFGHLLFELNDYSFTKQVGEYPYKPIVGDWDFINLGRLPDKSNLGSQILMQACKDAGRYVFFYANPGVVKTYSDEFEHKQWFDSGLEYVPTLLTKKRIRGEQANHIIVDEVSDPLVEDGVIEKELEDFYKRRVNIQDPVESPPVGKKKPYFKYPKKKKNDTDK